MTSDLEVVVARCNEALDWTGNVPAGVTVTIYNKGTLLSPSEYPGAINLQNIGNEPHTYLNHIITRYETLAPVTVFVQGRPFDHAHDLHKVLRGINSGTQKVESFLWLGFIIDTDDDRGRRLFVPWSKNIDGRELDIDGFHIRLFGVEAPEKIVFRPGGQFIATSETIRRRSIDFYRKALELAVTFPDAGHCFERLWDRIFGLTGVEESMLQGRETLYLKPIRRLV